VVLRIALILSEECGVALQMHDQCHLLLKYMM
jgi:hypothetical protein